jgi:hypothetical protein
VALNDSTTYNVSMAAVNHLQVPGAVLIQGLGKLGIFYFGQIFFSYRSSPNFKTYFFHGKNPVLVFDTKNGLGYILGTIFTNSTGHPVLILRTQ